MNSYVKVAIVILSFLMIALTFVSIHSRMNESRDRMIRYYSNVQTRISSLEAKVALLEEQIKDNSNQKQIKLLLERFINTIDEQILSTEK
tara:strand:+ start:976 stop:1245 length:270 start_codon:yes stop_codon:yes gene_type:complete